MRYTLVMLVIVSLLVLGGCVDLFYNPVQTAQKLVDDWVKTLKSEDLPSSSDSPTEFMALARKFIYVPDSDKDDGDVISAVDDLASYVLFRYFRYPTTLTQVKVLAAQENSTKFPNIVSSKPNFVEKVYIIALEVRRKIQRLRHLAYR